MTIHSSNFFLVSKYSRPQKEHYSLRPIIFAPVASRGVKLFKFEVHIKYYQYLYLQTRLLRKYVTINLMILITHDKYTYFVEYIWSKLERFDSSIREMCKYFGTEGVVFIHGYLFNMSLW